MKTLKSVLIIALISLSGLAYSQSGWYSVYGIDSNLTLKKIQMTSAGTGYSCGCYSNRPSGAFLKTTNGGTNWQKVIINNSEIVDLFFLNDLTGYVIGTGGSYLYPYGHIFKTTDGGSVWVIKDSIQNAKFFKVWFNDQNHGLITGKYGGAYFTTDGGYNWINRSPWNLWSEPQSIASVSNDVWFVSDNQTLVKTTNSGINWLAIDSVVGTSLYFFNQNTGIAYNYYFYKTTNSGNNWSKISTAGDGWGTSMDFVDDNTGFLCIFSTGRILKTTNGGYNWVPQIIPTSCYPYSISFVNSQTGFVSGYNGLIYKTTNGGSVFVANISSEVPDKFELGQNYPNPFNQFSILNFKCKIKSIVSLKVFDITGREVQTLVNETLAPGTYQVRFDGSGLASGLYYYSMSIDGKQTAVKKMVMVK